MTDAFHIDCRGRTLDCSPRQPHGAHVMGVLNVTPDSFSDGGRYLAGEAALRRAEEMLEEGAVIVDIGGESSRPKGKTYGEGAQVVDEDEEKRRVLPVVEAVARELPELFISVDTYKPSVAEAALEAGAHVINDITGLRLGDELALVCARAGAPLIVMHSLGTPGAMPHEHAYNDLLAEVTESLKESVRLATDAGVSDIVVDAGFGFGKSVEENLSLIRHTDHFITEIARPVLVGISRKSTIGAVLGEAGAPLPIEQRLYGALGATAVAVLRGASLVRTHDVRATVQMLRVLGSVA